MYGKILVTSQREAGVLQPYKPLVDGDAYDATDVCKEIKLTLLAMGGCGEADIQTVLEWNDHSGLYLFEIGLWVHVYDTADNKWYQGQIDSYALGLDGNLVVKTVGDAAALSSVIVGDETYTADSGSLSGSGYTPRSLIIGKYSESDPGLSDATVRSAEYPIETARFVMTRLPGLSTEYVWNEIVPVLRYQLTGLKFDGQSVPQVMTHLAILDRAYWGFLPTGEWYFVNFPTATVTLTIGDTVVTGVLRKGNGRSMGSVHVEGGWNFDTYPATYRYQDSFINPDRDDLPDVAKRQFNVRVPEIRYHDDATEFASGMFERYGASQYECEIEELGGLLDDASGIPVIPFPHLYVMQYVDSNASGTPVVAGSPFHEVKATFADSILCSYKLGHIPPEKVFPIGGSLPRKQLSAGSSQERYIGNVTHVDAAWLTVELAYKVTNDPASGEDPTWARGDTTASIVKAFCVPAPVSPESSVSYTPYTVGDKVIVQRVPGNEALGQWFTPFAPKQATDSAMFVVTGWYANPVAGAPWCYKGYLLSDDLSGAFSGLTPSNPHNEDLDYDPASSGSIGVVRFAGDTAYLFIDELEQTTGCSGA